MRPGSFPGVKRPGRGVDHPPPSNTEVAGRVELYICSPSGPSWPATGRTLPLHLLLYLPYFSTTSQSIYNFILIFFVRTLFRLSMKLRHVQFINRQKRTENFICLTSSVRQLAVFCTKSRRPINLLNPTGHVMHQQFNIQQLYALPTLYLCVLYLSENKQRLVPLTA